MEQIGSLWRDMGRESLQAAARTLREDNKLRNAVSRYYYAAYQTAVLLLYCIAGKIRVRRSTDGRSM